MQKIKPALIELMLTVLFVAVLFGILHMESVYEDNEKQEYLKKIKPCFNFNKKTLNLRISTAGEMKIEEHEYQLLLRYSKSCLDNNILPKHRKEDLPKLRSCPSSLLYAESAESQKSVEHAIKSITINCTQTIGKIL